MKFKSDPQLHAAARSGEFRVREDGAIETRVRWDGHRYVATKWLRCDRADGKGYRYVSWRSVRLKAHRLAWLLWHPGDGLLGWEINHLNGDRSDNRKANLERCDSRRQSAHAFETGLNGARGEAHVHAKLVEADVRRMRALRDLGVPYARLAREFGVTPRAAKLAVDGITWKHVTR